MRILFASIQSFESDFRGRVGERLAPSVADRVRVLDRNGAAARG